MQELQLPMEETIKSTPSYQPWLVCLTAALFPLYDFIQMNMFNAISNSFIQAFHLDANSMGNMAAFYLYSTVIVIFPVGLLLDRFSTKKLLLFAVTLSVSSTFIFSLTTNVTIAELSRFIAGIGGSFSFLTVIMLATRWFPATRLATIIGLVVTMAMLGGIVAQTPLTLLVDKLGWRHALDIDVLLGLGIISVIYYFVSDYPPNYSRLHQKLQQQRYALGLWQSVYLAIKNLQTWLCAWYTCLLNLPILLLGAVWGMSFLVVVQHLTREQASYVTSMIFVGTLVGSTALGWISDFYHRRKLLMQVGAGASLIIISIILYATHLSLFILLALFFILGFTTSSQVLSYPLIAENNSKLLTGAAEGISAAVIMSGGAIFQPLFGWIMEQGKTSQDSYAIHNFQTAMLIFPCAFIVGIILTFLIQDPQHNNESL